MQRTARCRWLIRRSRGSFVRLPEHCPCFINFSVHALDNSSRQQTTLMDFSSTPHQMNTRRSSQSIEEICTKNIWKLWKHRLLTVEQISAVLEMPPDAIITKILNFERTMDSVDWSGLSRLVGLTRSTMQASLRATGGANMSPNDVNHQPVSNNRRSCCQSLTPLQKELLQAMLECGLKQCDILQLFDLTVEKGTNLIKKTQAQDMVCTISSDKERLSHEILEEKEENTDLKSKLYAYEDAEVQNTFLAEDVSFHDDRQLFNRASKENEEIEDLKGSSYACEGAQGQKTYVSAGSLGPVTNIWRPTSAFLYSINWIQKNQMVVGTFTDWEAKHVLLLLMESIDNAAVSKKPCILENTSESAECRTKFSGRPCLESSPLLLRMHRALSLKAVLLNVLIHVPKRDVEFVVRSIKQISPTYSNIYHIRISKSPSCTCPDFVSSFSSGHEYRPCKHLFYIYMVQLVIEKDLEQFMYQSELMEEDLEKILFCYH